MTVGTQAKLLLRHLLLIIILLTGSFVANAQYAATMRDSVLLKPGGRGLPQGPFRNHIGLNEGKRWSEKTLDQCKEIGVKLLRFDLDWNKVEIKKGEYDWTEMDSYINGANARGIKVLLILGKTNPVYDSTVTVPMPGNYLWQPYANYVKASVQRYGKKDVMWELWNEPDIAHMKADMTPVQFINNAIGVMEIIRQIEPNATIVGPGSGYMFTHENESWNKKVLDNLKRQNILSYFFKNLNAWTGHKYTSVAPDNIYFDGVESYDLQRQTLDRAGATHVPYATGERGFTANPKSSQAYAFAGDEYHRLAYYMRQCLWGMHKEPDGFIINYVTVDVYDSGKQILGNPAGDALKVMLDNIGDYTITERIKVYDDGVVLLKFTQGNKDRYVIWDRKNRSLNLNLPLMVKKATIVDFKGNKKKVKSDKEYLTNVSFDGMPVFINPES